MEGLHGKPVRHLMKIWLDGTLSDIGALPISSMAHALHYGTGVFEGIRSYSAGPTECFVFRLKDHVTRLLRSADTLGLTLSFSLNALQMAVLDVLAVNALKDAYIRPLVFVGEGAMGLDIHSGPINRIHTLIAAWEWRSYFGIDGRGLSVKVGEWKRCFPKSGLNETKASGFYIDSFLAHLDAKRTGFDDAIMLDDNGSVAEATAANVFVVHDGRLLTPRTESALPGITRDTVIAIARELGVVVEEGEVCVEQMLEADEVFLTGTACEVAAVTKVNEAIVGTGHVGSLTETIAKSYQRIVRNRLPLRVRQDTNQWWTPTRVMARREFDSGIKYT